MMSDNTRKCVTVIDLIIATNLGDQDIIIPDFKAHNKKWSELHEYYRRECKKESEPEK